MLEGSKINHEPVRIMIIDQLAIVTVELYCNHRLCIKLLLVGGSAGKKLLSN